jgi:hypothetical protein
VEYEVGIRLDRIEAKLDKVLAQLDGMTPEEVQRTTQQLVAAADALEMVSKGDVSRPKGKGGK